MLEFVQSNYGWVSIVVLVILVLCFVDKGLKDPSKGTNQLDEDAGIAMSNRLHESMLEGQKQATRACQTYRFERPPTFMDKVHDGRHFGVNDLWVYQAHPTARPKAFAFMGIDSSGDAIWKERDLDDKSVWSGTLDGWNVPELTAEEVPHLFNGIKSYKDIHEDMSKQINFPDKPRKPNRHPYFYKRDQRNARTNHSDRLSSGRLRPGPRTPKGYTVQTNSAGNSVLAATAGYVVGSANNDAPDSPGSDGV